MFAFNLSVCTCWFKNWFSLLFALRMSWYLSGKPAQWECLMTVFATQTKQCEKGKNKSLKAEGEHSESCLAQWGVSWLRLQKNEGLSDGHVFSHAIMICRLIKPVQPRSLMFPTSPSFWGSPVFFPALFSSQLSLHFFPTRPPPPHQANTPLSQYNEIESTQIERSRFYRCQVIIEETDSCSTGGKGGGSGGGMGGFDWERVPGEVGLQLFYTQSFFVLSRSFWYFCPLVQPWSCWGFFFSVNAFRACTSIYF